MSHRGLSAHIKHLHAAIRAHSISSVKEALVHVPRLDTRTVWLELGRPLAVALLENDLEIAELLIEHGADPNYTCGDKFNLMIAEFDMEEEAELQIFLLRHGSMVCLASLPDPATDYVFRDWTPGNHLSWPVPLKRQMRALLVLCRGKLSSATLLYLFRWVSVAYWTWIPLQSVG